MLPNKLYRVEKGLLPGQDNTNTFSKAVTIAKDLAEEDPGEEYVIWEKRGVVTAEVKPAVVTILDPGDTSVSLIKT